MTSSAFTQRPFVRPAPADIAGGVGGSAADSAIRARYAGRTALIVNGDDVGITEIFTDATLRAYGEGLLSSATIVANGDDAPRALKLFREQALPLGVHLAITGDWAPLTSGPSLRNDAGLMWSTADEAIANVRPDEAAAEWDAQIAKVVDAGIELTHLDSHMLAYLQTPELFGAAFALAEKYRVPLIAGDVPGGRRPGADRLLPLTTYSGLYILPGEAAETAENRAAAYWEMLAGLGPGLHYLFTHQGFAPADGILTGDLGLRIDDSAFWTSYEVRAEMARRGYLVIPIEELKRDFEAALAQG